MLKPYGDIRQRRFLAGIVEERMKTRYAIQLAYDGKDFCGWQIQRGTGRHENPKPSIEGKMVGAIRELCDEEVTVTASGRTDAGVHASGQVAHFDLEESADRFSDENLRRGLIDRLPETIQIPALVKVSSAFHAKQTAGKQYSFYFQQGPVPLPHLRHYTFWNRARLDHRAMDVAAKCLMGKQDFATFCGGGAQVSSTIREIFAAAVTREDVPVPGVHGQQGLELIRIRLQGSGFLKGMVRRIAGTLRRIGEGHLPQEALAAILASGDRDQSGPPVPAQGLWLERVWYKQNEGTDFLTQPDSELMPKPNHETAIPAVGSRLSHPLE
ncbi:MAG: tRNA pseudouridine synthase A [Verrucomicrobiota bacterium]